MLFLKERMIYWEIVIIFTGSSHINAVCVVRWKFFKWRKNDDHNTDWSWSVGPSHQWRCGVISIKLESHLSSMPVSLPFLLMQHSSIYIWASHHAPRKSLKISKLRCVRCRFQFVFTRKFKISFIKRSCGQSVVICIIRLYPEHFILPVIGWNFRNSISKLSAFSWAY